jgi:hypothetical protein
LEIEKLMKMKKANLGKVFDKNSSQSVSDRTELIYDNLDMENIFSLLKIRNPDSISILEKIKAITSIILNKRRFDYLKDKCLEKNNGGKRVKVGSAVLQEFRVISIITESYISVRYSIMAKYFQQHGYLKDIPGTIHGFSLKKSKLRSDCWENKAEINILGNFGREYYVKINFFTHN